MHRITIRHLRELIAALDRRMRQPAAKDEARIARESAVLRRRAVTRLAQLEDGAVTAGVRPKPAP